MSNSSTSKPFTASLIIQGIDKFTPIAKGIEATCKKVFGNIDDMAEKLTAKLHKIGKGGGKGGSGHGGHGGKGGHGSGGGGGWLAGMLGESEVPGAGLALLGITALGEGIGIVKEVLEAAWEIGEKFSESLKGLKEKADEAATAQIMLENAMKKRGANKEQIADIDEYCEKMTRKVAIDKDVLKQGAAQLAISKMSPAQIKKMLPFVADLAAKSEKYNVTAEGMTMKAVMIGKAFNGNVIAFRKLGIGVSDAQAKVLKFGNSQQKMAVITRLMKTSVGGLAQDMGGSLEGVEARMHYAWIEIQKGIGKGLGPVRQQFAKWGEELLPVFQKVAKNAPYIIQGLVNFFGEAFPGLRALFDELKGGVSGFDFKAFPEKAKEWGRKARPIFDKIFDVVDKLASKLLDLARASQRLWDSGLGDLIAGKGKGDGLLSGPLFQPSFLQILDGLTTYFEKLADAIQGLRIGWWLLNKTLGNKLNLVNALVGFVQTFQGFVKNLTKIWEGFWKDNFGENSNVGTILKMLERIVDPGGLLFRSDDAGAARQRPSPPPLGTVLPPFDPTPSGPSKVEVHVIPHDGVSVRPGAKTKQPSWLHTSYHNGGMGMPI